jgi:hypothetical protein
LDDGCSADLFLENVTDADDVPEARAPTAGKPGFKGKRASKNLDATAEEAVTGRPSPPQISPKLETFFFSRPNRFHQSLLAYLTTLNSLTLRRFLPLLMV